MDEGLPTQPNEIFELIVKADEKMKYAKPESRDARAWTGTGAVRAGPRCGGRESATTRW